MADQADWHDTLKDGDDVLCGALCFDTVGSTELQSQYSARKVGPVLAKIRGGVSKIMRDLDAYELPWQGNGGTFLFNGDHEEDAYASCVAGGLAALNVVERLNSETTPLGAIACRVVCDGGHVPWSKEASLHTSELVSKLCKAEKEVGQKGKVAVSHEVWRHLEGRMREGFRELDGNQPSTPPKWYEWVEWPQAAPRDELGLMSFIDSLQTDARHAIAECMQQLAEDMPVQVQENIQWHGPNFKAVLSAVKGKLLADGDTAVKAVPHLVDALGSAMWFLMNLSGGVAKISKEDWGADIRQLCRAYMSRLHHEDKLRRIRENPWWGKSPN